MANIAIKCLGCGRVEVVDDKAELASDGSGHHAIPDDPESDWICYETSAKLDDKSAESILEAFDVGSVYAIAEFQPTVDELVASSVFDDARRSAREAADVAIAADATADATVKGR